MYHFLFNCASKEISAYKPLFKEIFSYCSSARSVFSN